MNRRVFLMCAGTAASCARDARPRLNVYNWSSYIDPASVAAFERERNVRIRYGTYESNEEMLAKISTGNSGWDVVFPTHNRLSPMVRHNLLQPLDHARLPGLRHLDAKFQAPEWDPPMHSGVPYLWNATGVAWNESAGPPPEDWNALWNESLRGRITMLDDSEDVLGACLIRLGYSFDSLDRGELQRAKAEAIRQKRLVRAYINAEVRDQLVAGDVLAAQLWSPATAQAIHGAPAGTKIAFTYPRSGFPLYCDCAALLRESSRTELAHEFLNWLLRPEVAAANARVAESATANGAARQLLPPDPVLYPARSEYERGVWPTALPAAGQRLRDRIWTEIKSA